MKQCGIYKLTWSQNGSIYVGSSVDIVVHVTDLTKGIAEAYQALLKSKGYDMTQAACIEKLLEAGYKSKTGKDYKPRGRG